MAEDQIAGLWDEEEDFDPLAVDDLDIDQEDMDDDNPLDTVDYPTMRNMPEGMRREAVYSPERQAAPSRRCFPCSTTIRPDARCWFPSSAGATEVA